MRFRPRSDSAPGALKRFDSRPPRPEAAHPPSANRTSQQATMRLRWAMTKPVHRIIGAVASSVLGERSVGRSVPDARGRVHPAVFPETVRAAAPARSSRVLDLAPASPRTVERVPAAPDRLTIGQLARLSGLTTRALRHYDKLGVLRPAAVGDDNGYRLYDRGQVEVARQIRALRELEVPLDEVRRIVADPDSADAQRRIAAHRARVEARLAELRTAHYFLGLLAGGAQIEDAMPIRPTAVAMDPQGQRKAAADLFNYPWTLLEKGDGTERESDLMIHAAHASRFFWEEIGEPVNHARGEWQIARVYAVLDRPEPALFHAGRCLQIVDEHGIGDFDVACAYEALARAHAVAGEREAARRYEGLGREAAQRIEDADDRDLVLADLDALP